MYSMDYDERLTPVRAGQTTNRFGLIIGGNKVKLAAAAFHQARLARNGKLLFIGGANNTYLLKLKYTHLAVTLSALPMQTAWR